MKYNRIISFLTALLCLAGAASCGKNEKSELDSEPKGVNTSEVIIDGSSSEITTESSSGDKDTATASKSATTAVSDKKDTVVTTASKGHSAGSSKPAAATAKPSSSPGTSAGSSSSGSHASSGGSQPTESSQNSGGGSAVHSGSNSGNGSENTQNPAAGSSQQSTQPPTEAAPEENTYTAEITLGSTPTFTGSNVTVDGSVVTISAGGDYHFAGTLADGQICVNTVTEDKVTIVLDGVDIHNSSGPAIFINEAKKCTVKVREGSENNLSDAGKNKTLDGVIYSNDTLRIKGGGTLNISAGNAHGICSDDDIIIENGTLNIESKKSGLIANDDITVSGGSLTVMGGTNGIKSKGSIHITGGQSVISGGNKEEKCSVYAAGEFSYTGGYLFAAGNQVSAPASSVNPYIIASFGTSVPGGTTAEMVLDSTQMISFTPHCSFRSLLMLAPEIAENSSFYTVIGGSASDDFSVRGTENIFEIN